MPTTMSAWPLKDNWPSSGPADGLSLWAVTLDWLNRATRDDFVATLGGVFEHSPWVAERAWSHRPFTEVDALHRAMVDEMRAARHAEQLALLRAHPDLGTRTHMSTSSATEQAGVGLDALTSQEFERLQSLNTEYRARFGFPFLFAVRGSTKHDILAALAHRLRQTPEAEFREALDQVARIARFRLDDLLLEAQ